MSDTIHQSSSERKRRRMDKSQCTSTSTRTGSELSGLSPFEALSSALDDLTTTANVENENFDYIPHVVNRIIAETHSGRSQMLTKILIEVLLKFYLKDKYQTTLKNGNSSKCDNDRFRRKYEKRTKQWVSDSISSLIQPPDSCIASLDALLIENGIFVGAAVDMLRNTPLVSLSFSLDVESNTKNEVNEISHEERNPNHPRNWFKQGTKDEDITNPYVLQIQSFLQESEGSLEALIS